MNHIFKIVITTLLLSCSTISYATDCFTKPHVKLNHGSCVSLKRSVKTFIKYSQYNCDNIISISLMRTNLIAVRCKNKRTRGALEGTIHIRIY